MKSAHSTFSNMPVDSIARMSVPTVNPSTPVFEIAALMVKHNIGAVIVVRGIEPVGIVTERDIIRRVIVAGRDAKEVVAQEVMTSPLISISHDRLVDEALEIMDNNHVRRLVVLKGENMIGLLTERRLLRAKIPYKPTSQNKK
ncbi:MAG: CBS domain-containing protein [Candidatus Bathyarchaeota archaeon]|nr:CBS domain-containing protein [Candidatus Bathyarchaeota archaeon]